MYHLVAYRLKSHLSRKHIPYYLYLSVKKNIDIFNSSKIWITNSPEGYKKQNSNAMIGRLGEYQLSLKNLTRVFLEQATSQNTYQKFETTTRLPF